MRSSLVEQPYEQEVANLGNMGSVVMAKTELLKILRKNREEHQTIYQEAKEGFKAAYVKELKRLAKEAKKGNFVMHVQLVRPVSFMDDYDKAIMMLEHTQRETILLQVHEFQSYVQDKWQWAQAFSSSNAGYSNTAQSLGAKYAG